MLYEFLSANREELIHRCRAKVVARTAPCPTEPELKYGIPLFLEQLTGILRQAETANQGVPAGLARDNSAKLKAPANLTQTAASHGSELLQQGFTVDQVVHDYGDLCQAITELAVEQNASIATDEFRTLNKCLDDAIAEAVTEYGRERDRLLTDEGATAANERLGFLAHELRNLLNSAMLAVDAIKGGKVGLTGATGAVLDRSLLGLRDLIERTLAEVRLSAGISARRTRVSVSELISGIQIAAILEAKVKGVELTCGPVAPGLWITADPYLLSAALTNLLQNGFKFTRPRGRVSLSVRATAERVLIEVADECGGLAAGKAEEMFLPFEQHSSDRSGLGLGLSISRRSVIENGGELYVRNLPGTGCVFTIDLPLMPAAAAPRKS